MHHRHLCAHAHHAFAASHARGFVLPGDDAKWGRPRPFVLDALALDVALDFAGNAVEAIAELTLRRIDPDARHATLDALDFELRSVELVDGDSARPLTHRYDGEVMHLDLSDVPDGGEARVRIVYRATPRRGLYFTKPDESRPDRPTQVWSQCQDQDGRHWFPCQDHPGQRMRTTIGVVVPKGWFALGNGVLETREEVADGTRFVWRQDEPHAAYLVTLAAGELDEAHETVGELPVDYYVPKGRGEAIERSLGNTPAMIELFGAKLSTPYPWAKYAQIVVADFIFGGMENTSATTLFERALLDPRAKLDVDMDSLVAHELAHQWFGDLVTCRDWSHAWLNEGFATYMEHVWKEHHEGREAYLYNLETDLALYLGEHGGRYGRAVVEKRYSTPIDIFDRHLYQKGGLVLHALRERLGDAAFWKGLAFYLERHRGGSVETRDLLRALEESSGHSLEELFHQWIERPGHPSLEVKSEHSDGVLTLTVRQKQAKEKDDSGAFHLRLPVEVVTEAGRESHVLDCTRARHTFALPCAEPPTQIYVDAQMSAPGPLAVELSTAMLIATLADESAPVRARWCAARTLAKRNEPRALRALGAALAQSESWSVRVEAAKALGEHRTAAARDLLEAGQGDADPRVRRSVASAYGSFRDDSVVADRLLEWIKKGDESYLVEAALRRSLGRTRDARAFDVLARSLAEDRGSWGDVVQAAAAEGLGSLRSADAIAPLLAVLEDVTTPATVRRPVISTLAGVRAIDTSPPVLRTVREAAERELGSYDPNVRIAVARLMTALCDRAGFAVLDRIIARDLDGRVRRAARESRRDLSARLGKPPEITELRDEVERLRQEVRELRGRVVKADAKPADEEVGKGG